MKTGVQKICNDSKILDSGFRRNDGKGRFATFYESVKFRELMEIVAEEPVFEAGLLAAGESEPADVRRQLSRWTKRGNCALSCQGERISAML